MTTNTRKQDIGVSSGAVSVMGSSVGDIFREGKVTKETRDSDIYEKNKKKHI